MKRLIITMQIGDRYRPVWNLMTPIIRRYAAKINADFKIITFDNPIYKGLSFFLNKFNMFENLPNYDQMIFLDSDILITPHAPDVFEAHPKLNRFYGMDEGYTDRARIVQPYIDKYEVKWRKNEYGTYQHYNGGVWLFGNKCNLSHDLSEYLCIKGYEENFLNYILQKNKVKTINMDRKWNKICSDETIPRRDAYFIHYAGPGHIKYKDKSEIAALKMAQIREDVKYFYGE